MKLEEVLGAVTLKIHGTLGVYCDTLTDTCFYISLYRTCKCLTDTCFSIALPFDMYMSTRKGKYLAPMREMAEQ